MHNMCHMPTYYCITCKNLPVLSHMYLLIVPFCTFPAASSPPFVTGLSSKQKEVYRNVLLRDIDMVNGTAGGGSAGRTVILNIVMQLRKCCNHPYLFAGVEDRKLDPLGDHLITSCGKASSPGCVCDCVWVVCFCMVDRLCVVQGKLVCVAT